MQQQNQPISINAFIKTFQIIHGALAIGILAILAFGFLSNDILSTEGTNMVFLAIGLTMLVIGIFIGTYLYKNRLTSITTSMSLQQKLSTYQTAAIIRYALIEGAGLFMGVQFLTSGNLLYASIAFVGLGIIMYLRPTKDKIAVDLKLTDKELQVFQKGDDLL